MRLSPFPKAASAPFTQMSFPDWSFTTTPGWMAKVTP